MNEVDGGEENDSRVVMSIAMCMGGEQVGNAQIWGKLRAVCYTEV